MKFTKIKLAIALACVAPVLMMGSALAQVQDIKERTLKFAYVQPKGSHMGFGVEKFSELVAKKSGNKIIIKGVYNLAHELVHIILCVYGTEPIGHGDEFHTVVKTYLVLKM